MIWWLKYSNWLRHEWWAMEMNSLLWWLRHLYCSRYEWWGLQMSSLLLSEHIQQVNSRHSEITITYNTATYRSIGYVSHISHKHQLSEQAYSPNVQEWIHGSFGKYHIIRNASGYCILCFRWRYYSQCIWLLHLIMFQMKILFSMHLVIASYVSDENII